jgi:hypothetical protein
MAVAAVAVTAADRAAENRLTSSLLQAKHIDGEVLEIGDPAAPVVGIFRRQILPEARGGAVLLHDSHSNADDTEIVRPLRLGLPDNGWSTLSLQLPIAYSGDRRPPDAQQRQEITRRLALGIDHFKTEAVNNIVVITVGDSAGAAIEALTAQSEKTLRALLLIGSTAGLNAEDETLKSLTQLKIPVVDVVAQFDRSTLEAAQRRRDLARETGQPYRQIVITAARPGYPATTGLLLSRISAWLAKHAAGQEVPR